MLVAKNDDVSNPVDARILQQSIGNAVKYYAELDEMDHSSFTIGKDMGYLSQVLQLIQMNMTNIA